MRPLGNYHRVPESKRHMAARLFETWRMRWLPWRWYTYEIPYLVVTNENIMTAWTRCGWTWRGRKFHVRVNEAPR